MSSTTVYVARDLRLGATSELVHAGHHDAVYERAERIRNLPTSPPPTEAMPASEPVEDGLPSTERHAKTDPYVQEPQEHLPTKDEVIGRETTTSPCDSRCSNSCLNCTMFILTNGAAIN
ncbi:hypothetical protein [Candidatus Poriferisodalis sp.]|uniref:hypothetical protein n=1 Tax=Candidatus Poriferisodalis sp. TaxID=3101277 RepID=UPI003B59696B